MENHATRHYTRFPDEDVNGPIDPWLLEMSVPPIDEDVTPRVALICLWYGPFPRGIEYTIQSLAYSRDTGVLYSFE